ncbi:hypothetical protein BC827DRAFT_858818 [Russula dissimulans]|nr:hypothetical protein BC827DRAFT_858818 [Russula dissimulans]
MSFPQPSLTPLSPPVAGHKFDGVLMTLSIISPVSLASGSVDYSGSPHPVLPRSRVSVKTVTALFFFWCCLHDVRERLSLQWINASWYVLQYPESRSLGFSMRQEKGRRVNCFRSYSFPHRERALARPRPRSGRCEFCPVPSTVLVWGFRFRLHIRCYAVAKAMRPIMERPERGKGSG